MVLEVLLILPSYIGIFVIYFRFKHIIKAMSEIDGLLNVLLPDTDERDEGENGRDFFGIVIYQGKGDMLLGKTPWTTARLKKVSDAGIEKLKNHFLQAEAKLKAEKTGNVVSKHVVNLYSVGVSRILKIGSTDQLRRDIDSDPVIRESMADIGALLVGTFGRFLTPLLIAAHTATEGFVQDETNLDTINEQGTAENLLSN